MTILNDIKTSVDFASEEDTGYDDRLLLELDGIVGELSQLTDTQLTFEANKDTTWESLIPNKDPNLVRLVKQYVLVSIRLKFDPPAGSILSSLERSLQSTAHRIILQNREESND
jgi:hypothetical protein